MPKGYPKSRHQGMYGNDPGYNPPVRRATARKKRKPRSQKPEINLMEASKQQPKTAQIVSMCGNCDMRVDSEYGFCPWCGARFVNAEGE